jgi:hypothetical protein
MILKGLKRAGNCIENDRGSKKRSQVEMELASLFDQVISPIFKFNPDERV